MPRVSTLPLTTGVGTVYVIEGGVSKRVVAGTMMLQNANAVAITGGSAAGLTSVGINTSSPVVTLDVVGNARVVNTSPTESEYVAWGQSVDGSTPFFILRYNTSHATRPGGVDIWNGGSSWIRFGTSNLERMIIDATGKIGFGTGSPLAQVEADSGAATRFRASSSDNSVYRGFEFGQSGNATSFGAIAMHLNSGELRHTAGFSGWGGYHVFEANGTARFRIDDSGVSVTGAYHVSGTQVLGTRKTGWTAASGTATRSGFNTATVTLAQLAEHVKALIDDFISHGAIGA